MPHFRIVSEEGATAEILPRALFAQIKEAALGPEYDLSVIVTSAIKMKKLNTIYRDTTHSTDILSFPVSETEGEIYLDLAECAKEAKKFGRPLENFLPFLFIHGCVHLIGHDHGATMEKIEERIRKQFKI